MLPFTMRKITFKHSIFYDTFLVERRYINEIYQDEMMNKYFSHLLIRNNIYLIIDHDVYMFLIIGSEKACLIDNGYGVGNIMEYVRTLTDKPVINILTHFHYDHVGGTGCFSEVYMNERDWDTFYRQNNKEKRYKYLNDEPALGFVGIPIEEYTDEFKGALLPAIDGQKISIGNYTLKIIETPGHTPGAIMVLIEEEKVIIYGDSCGRRTLLVTPGSSASKLIESMSHVKAQSKYYDTIWKSHHALECPLDMIDNVIECAQDILKGTDDKQPVSMHDTTYLAAKRVDTSNPMQPRLDGKLGNVFYTKENAV